jgi:alkanal monooxygenase alpha chain
MKLDLFLSTAHRPGQQYEQVFADALHYAVRAEELGYHAVWVNEHHFIRFGSCSDPLTMAAFLLGRTRRIRVGTAVVLVALHHPVTVAEQAATIDQLSGGRLDVGVGRGAYPLDWAVFDTPVEHSNDAVRGNLETILAAWRDDAVAMDSPWLSFPSAHVVPKPHTRPHPPVFLASSSVDGIAFAARLGIPLLVSWHTSPAEKGKIVERYRLANHRKEPIEHVLTGIAHVGKSTAAARSEIRESLLWWMREGDKPTLELERLRGDPRLIGYDQLYTQARAYRDTVTPEAMVEQLMLANPIGDIDHCRAWLRDAFENTASSRFALFMDLAGDRASVDKVMNVFKDLSEGLTSSGT